MKPVPINIKGELHVGGIGVALGYINNPKLTNEKFIMYNNERVYKTGDICKWNYFGQLEFIGRKDDQIKMGGYRIELSEIESYFNGDGVVIFKNNMLIAFVTSDNNISKIKQNLPSYMIPSMFYKIESFPLNSSGKIDRKKLALMCINNVMKNEYVEPRTEIEKNVVNTLCSILGINKIGLNDNIFEVFFFITRRWEQTHY